MAVVAPASHKSRAGVKESSSEFDVPWLKVPFETYEGLSQSQFQIAVGAHIQDAKLVPINVPKGWRRVEGTHPGKIFYVHMESGTISKFPKELYSTKDKCWIQQDGTKVPEDEVMMNPYMRAVKAEGAPRPAAAPAVAAAPPQAALPSPASNIKQTLPVAVLFPGQGSQYVKMLSGVKDMPAVKQMCDKATAILGYDILDLCLKGPESKLEQTQYCQPAMFIGGLAGVERLKADKPDRYDNLQAVAGLSLGEYTALCVAGVFDFETGLKLVKLRGEVMHEAAQTPPQGMLSVAGLTKETLSALCDKVKTDPGDVCQIANYLFPNGFSCAGHTKCLEKLQELCQKTEGCLQSKLLKTGGAFHTPCMAGAQDKLKAALKEAEPKMKPARCDVYMNVTGEKINPATPASEITRLLGEQITSMVMWEPCCRAMIRDGITEYYECGPMKQLKAMMKRIDTTAFGNTTTVDV